MKKQMMVTKAIVKNLPKLEVAYEQRDPIAHIHYFHVMYDWHWYVLAGEQVVTNDNHQWRYPKDDEEPNDWLFLAKVYSPVLHGDFEIGTVYLSDFDDFVWKNVLRVERDYIFEPKPMSECMP